MALGVGAWLSLCDTEGDDDALADPVCVDEREPLGVADTLGVPLTLGVVVRVGLPL